MKSWGNACPNSFLHIEKNKKHNPKAYQPDLQGVEPDDNASLLKDVRLPHSMILDNKMLQNVPRR